MTIASYDDIITAEAGGYSGDMPFYTQYGTAKTATVYTGQISVRHDYRTRIGVLPTLPGGKTYYAPKSLEFSSSVARSFIVARLTSFGSLNIATPTFTDASAAPTRTEGGVSRQIPSAVLMVVTTGLNATPGSFTITYQDQDANTAETTASVALTASAIAGTAAFVNLKTPDWGAIDITAATRTGGTTPTGVIEFFHVDPVCMVNIPVAGMVEKKNFFTDYAYLHQFAAGDKIAFIGMGNAVGGIQGKITYVAL